ncbi:PilZ domain-containing protein [Bradyrhizobium jicamae]|uniref:PilZ domain-containing protein n=1 Tax=Bradyrhizobium jicamae TaxID=280332 RepID=A0ABS5FIV7_9BRAD|nr:PilZ domain-containing protein [Bradyrhizobium jicamae]MBR0796731.1 PilZ domain-containing protein [Bradyrhizobium jicamae]MBR0935421.1 PilZ domain-containing protein [Bradyrhizobium jicamae]
MAYGDRKAERVRFESRHPVNLMGVDGTWRRNCVLIDVSQTGARLEVEGTLEVLRAQEFFLLLSSTGLAFRRCELVRVDGTEVGVRFIEEKKKKARAVIP